VELITVSTDNAQNADSSLVLSTGDLRAVSTVVRLGQVLNGLRYFAEVAWVTNSHADPCEYERLWSEVRILARELFGATERHPQIQGRLDEIWEDWGRSFQSEWHQDSLNLANSMIFAAQERGDDLPDGETPQDLYCRMAHEGTRAIQSLTEEFRGELLEELRIPLDLGVHRDQRAHPPLTRHTVEFQVEQQSFGVEGADCWTTVVPRPAWRMPTAPPTPREDWPSEDWGRQLEHLEALTETRPIEVEGATDAQAELELDLEPAGLIVSLRGRNLSITLQRRFYRLLELLLNQPGLTVPRLMRHWDQVGRAPTESRSTVDDTIAKLNNELLQLGFQVTSDVVHGKHVTRIPPPGPSST